MPPLRRLIAAALSVLAIPAVVAAQSSSASAKAWSLEFYGGASLGSTTGSGTPIAEFPVGDTFTTANGTPSRFQSSWRFGDGAALFTTVAGLFSQITGRAMPIVLPLDDVLRAPGARPGTAALFGLRLARQINTRWAVELSVERHATGVSLDDRWRDAVRQSADSFDAAFTALFETAPATGLTVVSTVDLPGDRATHTRVLAAVTRTLSRKGRLTTTASLGGGVELTGGSAPEVVLLGRYELLPFNQGQFTQRDDVRIVFNEEGPAGVGLAGLGVVYEVAAATALRLDVRVQATRDRATTKVRTAPATSGTSTQTLTTVTSPSLQFSAQTTPRSTLDASRGTTLTTFTGSGLQTRAQVTLGLVLRF